MTQPQVVGQNYAFSNSVEEQARLKLQAHIVAGWSRPYLAAAGLESGMCVLDLGTGMGDLAFLAAEIVGPSGSVTGLDRNATMLDAAKRRAAPARIGRGFSLRRVSLRNSKPRLTSMLSSGDTS